MEGVEQGHPVEQETGLHGGTPADEELPALVAVADDAGQYREVLRQVGLAPDGRGGEDVLAPHLHLGHQGVAALLLPLGRDVHLLEFYRGCVEEDAGIGGRTRLDIHLRGSIGIAQVGSDEAVLTRGDTSDAEIALHIGDSAQVAAFEAHRAVGYRCAVAVVEHVAPQGAVLGQGRQCKAQRAGEPKKKAHISSGLLRRNHRLLRPSYSPTGRGN